MRQTRNHLALIVDDDTVVGLITLTDVLRRLLADAEGVGPSGLGDEFVWVASRKLLSRSAGPCSPTRRLTSIRRWVAHPIM